jgi:hypothetical protein
MTTTLREIPASDAAVTPDVVVVMLLLLLSLLSKMMGKLPVSHKSTGSAALSQVVKFKEAKVPLQSCRATLVVALQISQDSHKLA